MTTWSRNRVTAALAMGGAVVALVGNALAPRINADDDVLVYRQIADSSRWAVADVIILVALLLVTAAFVGISRSRLYDDRRELADYARLAAVIGGAIAVVSVGIHLYAYRQAAITFSQADAHNQVGAFWATNAIDRVSSAMFAVWALVLLGIAPLLLGLGQLRAPSGGRVGIVALIGGAICTFVGFAELLKADQSTFDIPFAVGSVLVTIWLFATGVTLWRQASASMDLTDHGSRTTATPVRTHG